MKLRKSLSLILALSTLISCVPMNAVQEVFYHSSTGGATQDLTIQPYTPKSQSLFSQPVFGKNSYWTKFRRFRQSLPNPLAEVVASLYPEEISNPIDRAAAEGVETLEARLAEKFSWRNLPRTLLNSDTARRFGLHKWLLWDRLKKRVKGSLYNSLPIPFVDYRSFAIPAMAAQIANQYFQPLQIVAQVDPVDTAVGVVDAALAGESAEKITTNNIIKRTATALAFCLLVNPFVSKAGDQIGETATDLGLSMPSNRILWGLCTAGLWFAKGYVYDKAYEAAQKIVDVAGKPLAWARQKHNHIWNKSIWKHNKPFFDKHFTDTLMIDGEVYSELIKELQEIYTQLEGAKDEDLLQRFYEILGKLSSDKYEWQIRQDSDDDERSQDLNQNIKAGLKNNSCPECRQLLAEGKVEDVCCIGRYRF